MKTYIIIFITLLIIAPKSAFPSAELSDEERGNMIQMLTALNVVNNLQSFLNNGFNQFAKDNPNRTNDIDRIRKNLNKEPFLNTFIKIYSYYFSSNDVKEMLSFLDTKEGKFYSDVLKKKYSTSDAKNILTKDEYKRLNDFFGSDTGKRFIEKNKLVGDDIYIEGKQIAARIFYKLTSQ